MKHAELFSKEFDKTLEGFMPGLYKLPGVDFRRKMNEEFRANNDRRQYYFIPWDMYHRIQELYGDK